MRAVTGVWRWRRNALRRATDRREAWLALAALLLMVLAAPALGWVCGSLTNDALQESVRAQRTRVHATKAVVLRPSPHPARRVADPEVSSERSAVNSVVARWKAPDGTTRAGTVPTSTRRHATGAVVEIWTDARGRPAPRPMDGPTARTHAVLAGTGVALLSAAVIEGGRRLIVWRMVRRRYDRLDRAWAATGPDWGRTGTGS